MHRLRQDFWGRHRSRFNHHLFIIMGIASLVTGVLAGCSDDNGGGTNPIVATKLGFVVQPTTVATGAVIAPAIRVAVQDAGGSTATTSSASVTLAIASNPGGATLSGTVTKSAVNGVATFSDLSLDQLGAAYTLTATASGLTAATSSSFDVVATSSIPLAITVTTSGNNFVSVRNGSQPAVDTLKVGGTVTWNGLQLGLHMVVSDGPEFFTSQSAALDAYGPITLSAAGTYNYHCAVHGASMHGTIEVVP